MPKTIRTSGAIATNKIVNIQTNLLISLLDFFISSTLFSLAQLYNQGCQALIIAFVITDNIIA